MDEAEVVTDTATVLKGTIMSVNNEYKTLYAAEELVRYKAELQELRKKAQAEYETRYTAEQENLKPKSKRKTLDPLPDNIMQVLRTEILTKYDYERKEAEGQRMERERHKR